MESSKPSSRRPGLTSLLVPPDLNVSGNPSLLSARPPPTPDMHTTTRGHYRSSPYGTATTATRQSPRNWDVPRHSDSAGRMSETPPRRSQPSDGPGTSDEGSSRRGVMHAFGSAVRDISSAMSRFLWPRQTGDVSWDDLQSSLPPPVESRRIFAPVDEPSAGPASTIRPSSLSSSPQRRVSQFRQSRPTPSVIPTVPMSSQRFGTAEEGLQATPGSLHLPAESTILGTGYFRPTDSQPVYFQPSPAYFKAPPGVYIPSPSDKTFQPLPPPSTPQQLSTNRFAFSQDSVDLPISPVPTRSLVRTPELSSDRSLEEFKHRVTSRPLALKKRTLLTPAVMQQLRNEGIIQNVRHWIDFEDYKRGRTQEVDQALSKEPHPLKRPRAVSPSPPSRKEVARVSVGEPIGDRPADEILAVPSRPRQADDLHRPEVPILPPLGPQKRHLRESVESPVAKAFHASPSPPVETVDEPTIISMTKEKPKSEVTTISVPSTADDTDGGSVPWWLQNVGKPVAVEIESERFAEGPDDETSAPSTEASAPFKPSAGQLGTSPSPFTLSSDPSSVSPLTTVQAITPKFGSESQNLFGTTTTTSSLFGNLQSTTATPIPSLFGTSTTTPSLFGASTTATTPALFGTTSTSTTAPALFGTTSTSTTAPALFGTTSTSTTTPLLFGTSTTTPSLFGTTSAPSTTLSLFGTSTATPSLFGTTSAPATTPSLFGTSKMTPSLFGTSSTSSTTPSLFGTSTMTPSLFGTTSTSSTTPSLFGASATTPSLFGASATTPSLFGTSSTSATTPSWFGTSATTPSLFETTSKSETTPSLFGTTSTSTTTPALFGTTSTSTTTPSLFGTSATTPSLLGTSTPTSSIFGTTTFGQTPVTTSTGSSMFGTSQFDPSHGPASFNAGVFGPSSLIQQWPTSQAGVPTTSSMFGTPSTFGSSLQQPLTTFGQSAAPFGTSAIQPSPSFGPSMFGVQPTSQFGTPSFDGSSSVFGNAVPGPNQSNTFASQPSDNLFGAFNRPSPMFGTPSDSVGAFGQASGQSPGFGVPQLASPFGPSSSDQVNDPSPNPFAGANQFTRGKAKIRLRRTRGGP